MVIAIDFDGTCVTHEFPNVGKDIGAAHVLRKLVSKGHKLVLFTMRCDSYVDGKPARSKQYLAEAVKWFRDNNIPLYGVQVNPTQRNWTSSPKAYAEMYIDDAALGVPLKYDPALSSRHFVDWESVEGLLTLNGVL